MYIKKILITLIISFKILRVVRVFLNMFFLITLIVLSNIFYFKKSSTLPRKKKSYSNMYLNGRLF